MANKNKYINVLDFMQKEYPTTFIIGARGVGKTVNSIASFCRQCYDHKTKFVYLRRYKAEIDTLGLNLELISKISGLNIDMEIVKDDSGRKSKMITAEGVPVGYLVPLSVASNYKSNDYTNTEIIIYDEFIDIRGRELKEETQLYLNFAMTVFRDFTKYKALFLANATNIFNCYFVNFNVLPIGKITKNKELGIKIVRYQTSDDLNKRNATVLAKQVRLIEGAGGSSLDNEWNGISDDFLRKIPKKSKCYSVFKLGGVDYGYWRTDNGFIISEKFDPSCSNRYLLDGIEEDYNVLDMGYLTLRNLLFKHKLFFTSLKVRGIWLSYIKNANGNIIV